MNGYSSTSTTPNSWPADMQTAWWTARGETVQVLGTEQLWGNDVATVIVPSCGRVERVPAAELQSVQTRRWSRDEIAWRAASGLARRAMATGEPLAVARGGVEPLPHQLAVLDRALATEPLRLLLADEVGLGKTIDTGLNPWTAFDQVVCSLDAVKPVRARSGWTPERVAEHNELRAQAIVEAGWDLVVIDEAHHVAGSSDDVARHILGRRLAETVPRVLLLSATPHSGKSDAFARLLGLLDDAFLRGRPLLREHVMPLVVRTEKRRAIDSAGRPLFRPRTTTLVTVPYGQRQIEQALYDAVTDYVRHGYRVARAEHRPAVGFLVLLMQRLVSSRTGAILAALERRLIAVTAEGQQLRLFSDRIAEWGDLTGEEQQAALADAQGAAWESERAEVELLVDLARKAASAGIDTKARYLLDLLGTLARQEGDPNLKAVIFTEFVPTQEMLLEVLGGAGIPTVAVNGSMSINERRQAQEAFRDSGRALVSTDAGGEGVNLQFAHVVINYDLP